MAEGDTLERAAVRARLEHASTLSLLRIIGTASLDGIGLEDADAAIRVLERSPGAAEAVPRVSAVIATALVNRGRFSELRGSFARTVRVAEAVSGGDTTGVGAAVQELVPIVSRTSVPPDSVPLYLAAIVTVEAWRVLQGDTRGVARAANQLRQIRDGPGRVSAIAEQNAPLLETMVAVVDRHPDAAARLRGLDGLLLRGEPLAWISASPANLIAARLHEALGDRAGALAATRRRTYHFLSGYCLSSYVREEGRLAALTGDRAGAIRAYRHYLALRANPDPAARPELERVRTELARLVGEPRR